MTSSNTCLLFGWFPFDSSLHLPQPCVLLFVDWSAAAIYWELRCKSAILLCDCLCSTGYISKSLCFMETGRGGRGAQISALSNLWLMDIEIPRQNLSPLDSLLSLVCLAACCTESRGLKFVLLFNSSDGLLAVCSLAWCG